MSCKRYIEPELYGRDLFDNRLRTTLLWRSHVPPEKLWLFDSHVSAAETFEKVKGQPRQALAALASARKAAGAPNPGIALAPEGVAPTMAPGTRSG